jgi:hypothetical protein
LQVPLPGEGRLAEEPKFTAEIQEVVVGLDRVAQAAHRTSPVQAGLVTPGFGGAGGGFTAEQRRFVPKLRGGGRAGGGRLGAKQLGLSVGLGLGDPQGHHQEPQAHRLLLSSQALVKRFGSKGWRSTSEMTTVVRLPFSTSSKKRISSG